MAGRKVLVLEMGVRNLPPEPRKEVHSMRHNRLRLVVLENSTATKNDNVTRLPTAVPLPRPGARLRLVETDEEAPPDDAA
jgi:hypothetical protein